MAPAQDWGDFGNPQSARQQQPIGGIIGCSQSQFQFAQTIRGQDHRGEPLVNGFGPSASGGGKGASRQPWGNARVMHRPHDGMRGETNKVNIGSSNRVILRFRSGCVRVLILSGAMWLVR